jgi:pyruvate dehydrogenase (quinone)
LFFFAAAGIKRIYGIVGDSLNGLTDAIRKQEKIEWLHVRDEERLPHLRQVPKRA